MSGIIIQCTNGKKLGEGEELEPLTLYETLVDMECNLCEVFTGLDPLSVRKERAIEVLKLFERTHSRFVRQTKIKNGGKETFVKNGLTYRPAGDNWF